MRGTSNRRPSADDAAWIACVASSVSGARVTTICGSTTPTSMGRSGRLTVFGSVVGMVDSCGLLGSESYNITGEHFSSRRRPPAAGPPAPVLVFRIWSKSGAGSTSGVPGGAVGRGACATVGSPAVPRRSAAALACSVATAALLLASCSSGSSGAPTASAFLADWSTGNLQAAAGRTGAPDRALADLQQVTNDLQVGGAQLHLGTVSGGGSTATATFSAALTLTGLGVWRYQGRLGLRQTGGHWVVAWAPSDIYPGLKPGQRLGRTRNLPSRGAILDRTGAPLVVPTPVVTVGIVPARLTDPAGAIAALQATTGSDPARVQQLLVGAKPDQFIPVITLRQADYAKARPVLFPIPGLSFQQKTENLPPTPTFGRAVLGQIGQATADALKQAGPGFETSDDVGLSGLELAYQRQLAGTPSGSVVVLDAQGQAAGT